VPLSCLGSGTFAFRLALSLVIKKANSRQLVANRLENGLTRTY
jgi:hypothetical protein